MATMAAMVVLLLSSLGAVPIVGAQEMVDLRELLASGSCSMRLAAGEAVLGATATDGSCWLQGQRRDVSKRLARRAAAPCRAAAAPCLAATLFATERSSGNRPVSCSLSYSHSHLRLGAILLQLMLPARLSLIPQWSEQVTDEAGCVALGVCSDGETGSDEACVGLGTCSDARGATESECAWLCVVVLLFGSPSVLHPSG